MVHTYYHCFFFFFLFCVEFNFSASFISHIFILLYIVIVDLYLG